MGYLLDLADARTGISVGTDGLVSYDPAVDGKAFSGQGTNTVVILPHHITVDATNSSNAIVFNHTYVIPAGTSASYLVSVGGHSISTTEGGGRTVIGTVTIDADSACGPTQFEHNGDVVTISCSGGCVDSDGDGFGNPGSAACMGGAAQDCNDQNTSIFPGALELPGNEVDENCDGSLGACDPLATWKNHGQFVRCVSHEVNDYIDMGLITEDEGDALVTNAAKSSVGK